MASLLLAAPQAAWAGDEIRASANVDATAGYSSNPFSEIGPSLGSADLQIEADPQIRWIGPRSAITARGKLDYEHYFSHYSDTSDYLAGLDYAGTPSTRLTTHASASYESSIIGGGGVDNGLLNPTQPLPPVTTGPDLALFGTRARRRDLSLSGGLGYSLSARSSLTASGFFDRVRYSGFQALADYNGYGGTGGYSRRVSTRLQLGVQASVSHYSYSAALSNSQVYSLQATINDDFGRHWNLQGTAGGSYSDRTVGGKSVSPTGSLQLCHTTTRVNACLTVSEAVLPTGFTGTVVTRSAGASYSYELSEHSRISVSGTYSHNAQPAFQTAFGNASLASSYAVASASYDRTLRPRLHFLATALYRNVYGGTFSRPADVGGTLGFSARFGDIR